jgi:hypothetical protein
MNLGLERPSYQRESVSSTSIISIKNSTGNTIICYKNFCICNFPYFLLHCFPFLYAIEWHVEVDV